MRRPRAYIDAQGITMRKFFKRPWLIVAVVGAITVFFAAQLPRAQLDNNNFRFVPKNAPERITSSRIDETFGSHVSILVGFERRYGTVMEADFLSRLKGYVEGLEDLDVVESVMSIVSTDYITGDQDGIVVEPLVPDDFTGTKKQIAELKDRVLSWDLYRNSLVSDDFRSTQVLIYLDMKTEEAGAPKAMAVYRDVKKMAKEAGFPGTEIYVTGLPVFSGVVNEAMSADLIFLVPLVVLVVLMVLFLSFRRAGGIILPLLTVVASATWAIGAMPLAGIKLSIMSAVLPVILVAVGSAYGIHVVSHYYDEMADKKGLDDEDHRELIFAVLRRVRDPVFLAAVTTLAGFVSFCFTPVVPIFEFGIFSSLGVLASFAIAVTLIPALLIIRGPAKKVPKFKKAEIESGKEDPLSGAIADALGAMARKRRTVLALTCLVVIISAFGVSRLVVDNVFVEYFKPDTDIVRSDNFMRKNFGGSKTVSLVVSSDKPGEVLRPDVLAAMDGLSAYMAEHVPEVGKTVAFTDMVKRINQVLNVDESPEGLRPAPGPAEPSGEPAFGFGPVEGEPAFGFSSAGGESAFGFGSEAEDGQPAPKAAAAKAEPLDDKALAKLVNKALSGGGKRGLSVQEFQEQLSRATNYRGMSYYEIPTVPERYGKRTPEELKTLVSNYLVLLSGDISAFADDPLEPKAICMNVQLRTVGQIDTNRAMAAMRGYAAEHFPPDVKIEIGGAALVEQALNNLVVQSQLTSVGLSLLMVFLILSFYYRSGVAGLIGLVSLSASILVNFAVMWAFGIKLNIGTSMMASLIVGIGIDYIIHYMAAYHREYLATQGQGDFLRRTFLTSGKAILFNAAAVGAGFAVLILSRFNMLSDLGLLIALAMATSAVVSLTVLPVLLNLINPAFIRRPLPQDRPAQNTQTQGGCR